MFVLTVEMKCGNAPARTVFRCAVRVSLQPLRFCEIHEFEKETDMIVPARWDTDNFYIKVGNLIAEGGLNKSFLLREMAHAREEHYDLLYLKGVNLPCDCLSENVILADEKVVYVQVNSGRETPVDDERVASALNSPLTEELLQLSYESGKYSRYRLDENFPKSVFDTLYRLWIVRSLNGEIATDVLVYSEGGHVLGVLTYKINENEAEIGIVAVSPEAAGKGIGSKLMQSFLSRMALGVKISVATQKRNRVACHYYEKNGFHIESVTNVYHLWIK